jgi:hypothetical protein
MNKSYSAKTITIGGISTALIVISLFAGIVTINNKLFFLALATFFGALPCIINGGKGGLISYAAAAILSFIILPNKFYAGVYALFGIYPIVKLICERRGGAKEKVFKYLWFNVTAAVSYFIYKDLIYIGGFLKQAFGIILIIVLAQVLFFVYDYTFTVFITFTKDKIFKEV